MHETQSWFAGVDWASQKHDVWLADGNGKRLGKRRSCKVSLARGPLTTI